MNARDLNDIAVLAELHDVTVTLRPEGFHLRRHTATLEATCIIPYSSALAAFFPSTMFECQMRTLL